MDIQLPGTSGKGSGRSRGFGSGAGARRGTPLAQMRKQSEHLYGLLLEIARISPAETRLLIRVGAIPRWARHRWYVRRLGGFSLRIFDCKMIQLYLKVSRYLVLHLVCTARITYIFVWYRARYSESRCWSSLVWSIDKATTVVLRTR